MCMTPREWFILRFRHPYLYEKFLSETIPEILKQLLTALSSDYKQDADIVQLRYSICNCKHRPSLQCQLGVKLFPAGFEPEAKLKRDVVHYVKVKSSQYISSVQNPWCWLRIKCEDDHVAELTVCEDLSLGDPGMPWAVWKMRKSCRPRNALDSLLSMHLG